MFVLSINMAQTEKMLQFGFVLSLFASKFVESHSLLNVLFITKIVLIYKHYYARLMAEVTLLRVGVR